MAGLRKSLMHWYRQNARDLPWRRSRDPYEIWISEAMLQQTQVSTVIPYYGRFLTAFPTLESLAAETLDAVLKAWEGLGYYARARNLQKACRICVEQHRGRVPSEPAAFRRLPARRPQPASGLDEPGSVDRRPRGGPPVGVLRVGKTGVEWVQRKPACAK